MIKLPALADNRPQFLPIHGTTGAPGIPARIQQLILEREQHTFLFHQQKAP